MEFKILTSTFIFLLSIFGLNMQQDAFDYPTAWKEVDQLIEKQLPQSALDKIEEIYTIAQKEQNSLQVTKSVFYKGKITLTTEENGVEKVIGIYENEILKAKTPFKEILESNLAGFYLEYFNNNRYVISQRTELSKEEDGSVRTMSTQSFVEKINSLYLASVADYSKLAIPTEDFKELLIEGYNEAGLNRRPKLYDVLGDKVINYLNQGDMRPTLPSDKFSIDNDLYFSSKEVFENIKITTADKLSPQYQLLVLYQNLLRSQPKGSLSDISTDLSRLGYVHNNFVGGNKRGEKYVAALISLSERAKKNEEYANTAFAIASYYSQQASYENQVIATEWCKKGIKEFPKSNGAISCQNLLNNIEQKQISVTGKEAYPIDQLATLRVNYKNVSTANIKLFQIEQKEYIEVLTNNNREIESYISGKKPIKSWQEELNDTTYITHSGNITVPPLDNGLYILKVSDKEDGGIDNYISFTITDLSFVSIQNKGNARVIITNRATGEAVSKAEIDFYKQEYDYNTRKPLFSKVGTTSTNSQGLANAPLIDRALRLYIQKKDDYFMPNNQLYSSRDSKRSTRKSTELFTDRAIYRPGQTILFKGLMLEYSAENIPSILASNTLAVTLKNANYQEVAKSNFESNKFGTFSGSFTIPQGSLTGNYTIQTPYGGKSIRVEEYKRPTFEVTFDKLKDGIALGDSVIVSGKAIGLAGNSISNSKVDYTIYRQLNYPWRCYYFPYPREKEVVSIGNTTTDDKGAFDIDFLSKKENTENIRGINYSYTITVNVVDPSGESHEATKYVSLLDSDFYLDIENEDEIDLKNDNKLIINALNSEGTKQEVKGNYSIIKLVKKPNTLEEGEEGFYYKQNPYEDWSEGKLVQTGAFTAGQNIPVNKLEVGLYLIKATSKDSKNNELIANSYIAVKDSKKGNYPATQLLFTDLNAKSYEPGESLKLLVGTSDPTVYSYYILTRGNDILKEGWLKVKSTSEIDYTITELDRGGLQLMLVSIKNNKPTTKQIDISVPWSNKELDIKFETFRDKIEPGQKEQYNIVITPKKGAVQESEVLMAMYDASLDQFTPHSWRSSFFPNRYQGMMFVPGGFNSSYGYQKRGYTTKYQEYEQIIYPELLGFEGNRYYGIMYESSGGAPSRKMMKSSARPDANNMEMDEVVVMDAAPVIEGNSTVPPPPAEKTIEPIVLSPRTNLNETVFFYPTIYTDQSGKVTVSYTINDALTRWKLMTFAHTTDLKTGYDERFITTSKDIMIQPNSPRFIRLGDELWFTARVSNMTGIEREYDAILVLRDDIKNSNLIGYITATDNTKGTLKANETRGVAWKINVPSNDNIDLIRYIASVVSGNKSDAEQNYLPVLTSKFSVIETMPLYVNGKQTKSFEFNALDDSKTEGRINKTYTVEYTSNPVWFAIQALPYLKSSGNISTTSLVNQYFANTLGKDIIAKNPLIQQVFEIWKTNGAEALKSSLQKNSELKTMVLEETPWVLDALDEQDQKANIARYFDQNTLNNELAVIEQKLVDRQTPNGGYSWMPGGKDNELITLYILESFGKIAQLGIENNISATNISKAIKYSEARLLERYTNLQENKIDLASYKPSFHDVYHLNVRSYFDDQAISKEAQTAYDFYTKQTIKYWNKLGLYGQSLAGQYLFRKGNSTYKDIRKSILERSFYSAELGRYWNSGNGYRWSELPIETHTAILDFFLEINEAPATIDELKIWLLKNKQVSKWDTDKATASAIYSLLEKGSKKQTDLKDITQVEINVGGENISTNSNKEVGTGYIKKSYSGSQIEQSLKTIKIQNNSDHITWGGIYYQYFDDASNIKGNATGPLKITKEIYKVVTTSKGEELIPIKGDVVLNPGDQIASRMIVVSDRDMEFIDIKDMRGAGIEPNATLSKYYWKGGLYYYHSIRDLSDNYFIEYLPKGSHVFEQRQRVVHRGKYSSGLATIQSSYAPQFGSNSQGFIIEVK